MSVPRSGTAAATALLLAALLSVTVVPAAGGASAALPHEDQPRNHTVVPVSIEDRQPGIDDASYYRFAAPNGQPDFDGLESVDHLVTRWEEGVINRCSPAQTEVAGVDRGNDDPGTRVDVDITLGQYIESQYGTAHELHVEFTESDQFGGEGLRFGPEDELVAHHVDCWGNPEEPGWYQVTATINGTTPSGEQQQFTSTSHYFWICDCQSAAEARQKLGLPPSAPEGRTPSLTAPPRTATQSPTADGGDGNATAPGFGFAVVVVAVAAVVGALAVVRAVDPSGRRE